MKKKLFLGIGIIVSFAFLFFALEQDNSSIFNANLLEESSAHKIITANDWKVAFENNDIDFFQKNIADNYQDEFFKFLENSPLKMDVSVKKVKGDEFFFSFFGAKKGSSKLNDNNYGYIGKDFLFLSPLGTFSLDTFNTALFTNTSSFPLFLDGDYVVTSHQGEDFSAHLISLEEVEKNHILPNEIFTVETDAKNFTKIESIKYGFTLSLVQ